MTWLLSGFLVMYPIVVLIWALATPDDYAAETGGSM